MKKDMLVVGSGAREHALVWKLAQSKDVGRIFVAPGNAGTAAIAENLPIQANDIGKLLAFARKNNISLTVVGPDETLALGIVDKFQKAGLKIFGPTKKAAKIEWSKTHAKRLMKKYGIPTADYTVFSNVEKAVKYVRAASMPVVVKADGLALGKGVFICQTVAEAENALTQILDQEALGPSGKSVVIEEFLEGVEVSAHAICDGKNFLLFPLAQDHKRIGEGNTGPNTGGMGTICPVREPKIAIEKIIAQTLNALKEEGVEFIGCLFPGIILTASGPKVLEFNARFGDPEAQVYMRLLKDDLLEILDAAAEQRLSEVKLSWQPGAAACVVLASAGYPRKYETGLPINGLPEAENNNVTVFHAGTKKVASKTLTAGGRVLSVTATGINLESALKLAYAAINKLEFKGKYYRKDIGIQYTK